MMHPQQSRLLALLAGSLSEEDASDLFGHLAFCEACAGRLRALEMIRADYDGAWERFVEALATGAEAVAVPETVAATEPRRTRSLALAVRLLLDTSRRLAALGTQTVSDLVSGAAGYGEPQLCPQFEGVGDPDLVEEIHRCRADASADLDAGDASAARRRLEEAERLREGVSAVAELDATGEGRPPLRLIADSRRGTITALAFVEGDRPGAASAEGLSWMGRVVLLRMDGSSPAVADFKSVEGASYLLAEIDWKEGGEFVVGVEEVDGE